MLRSANALKGYSIHATDGDIGYVDQFYFDDQSWGIRYLVVQTGQWLLERKVLISNYSIGEVDENERKLLVTLTKEQIENSPDYDQHLPVSRRWEANYAAYYGWSPYWESTGFYDPISAPGMIGTAPFLIPPENTEGSVASENTSEEDSHLQSTHDVSGYHIKASDGDIGHVVDFILDDRTWTIRYVEVDTRNWWPGKKVLFAPAWIQDIEWSQGQVAVNLPRQTIQEAPEYDPNHPISAQYEIDLLDYYGNKFEASHPSLYTK
jgi:hypothetical protein